MRQRMDRTRLNNQKESRIATQYLLDYYYQKKKICLIISLNSGIRTGGKTSIITHGRASLLCNLSMFRELNFAALLECLPSV